MKNNPTIGQKIMIIVLAIVMLIGSYAPARPAHAQTITSDIFNAIYSGLSYAVQAVSKAYDAISSYAENDIWIKDYILDPLAWAAAKGLLQNITDETVNWVNSGFQGSPAYVTNPTSLFNGIANQATNAFLADNGPLSSLCSPISLNVRLALALNQAGASGGGTGSSGSGVSNSPYSCTLSTIINNVQGATINGFEAGDFSQGGWPAFASLAEPQNSFYGAYLEAQSQLDSNIANRTAEQNNQLNRGSGFLSYTTCTYDPTITDSDAAYDPTIQYDAAKNGYDHCSISTPGSTIKSSLDKALGSSQDTLVQASMLDEIIGDLAAGLINQVLGPGGLGGVSKPSSNGQPSYLSQVETEAANMPAPAGTASSLSSEIGQYEPSAVQQQGYYAASVDLAEGAVETLNNYASICTDSGNDTNAGQLSSLAATASSTEAQLQAAYNATTDYINNLNTLSSEISSSASSADTSSAMQQINSLNPALKYLVQSAQNAQTQTNNTNADINKLVAQNSQATTLVEECGGSYSLVTVSNIAATNYPGQSSSTNNSPSQSSSDPYQQCIDNGVDPSTCATQYSTNNQNSTTNTSSNDPYQQCIDAGVDQADCLNTYGPGASNTNSTTAPTYDIYGEYCPNGVSSDEQSCL